MNIFRMAVAIVIVGALAQPPQSQVPHGAISRAVATSSLVILVARQCAPPSARFVDF